MLKVGKKKLILGLVGATVLGIGTAGFFASRGVNFFKLKAAGTQEKYELIIDASWLKNVDEENYYFDLAGKTPASNTNFAIEGCSVSCSETPLIGGDYIFDITETSEYYSCFVQIDAYLLDTGDLIDYYLVGYFDGVYNNHFQDTNWLISDDDGAKEIYIYFEYYSGTVCNSIQLQQIVFEYMC